MDWSSCALVQGVNNFVPMNAQVALWNNVMSCWVVPAVAAEYWGVSLDVVWDRIYSDLVPHKTERGFVFIDVDPWNPDPSGALHHTPPATYVEAEAERASGGASTMVCEGDEEFLDDCLDEDEESMLDGGDLPE